MLTIALDIRTLSIITVIFAFVLGIGLAIFARQQKIFSGLWSVGAGLVIQGCGFLFISMRGTIPAAWSVVVANVLLVVGLLLVNDGICRFRNISRSSGVWGLILACANLAIIIFCTYTRPSIGLRIFSLSTTMAIIAGLCAWNTVRGSWRKAAAPQQLTATGFALFSAFMLFRALWALGEDSLRSFMNAGSVHALAFMAVLFLFLCVSYGMVWMANSALLDKLGVFERIISATPDIIMLMDTKGSYTMVNDASIEILGLSRKDILGRTSADLFGKEFYETVTLPNLAKAARGEVSTTTHWLGKGDAERRFMALHYHPVPDAGGRITQVAISARDMTAQQKALEDRQRIFTLSLDMLCVAGMDGYFRELNPAWERTLGWDKETLMRSQWIDFVHPDDVQATLDAGRALMEGKATVDFINRYRTRDGLYRYISWTSHPDQSSQLIYAVARDVTERMLLENQLKEQAMHDPLTGAGNRRLFMQRAGEEINRSVRYDTPLSLLMLDIDHFKAINDSYGHDAGDEVLKALVKETGEMLRDSDVLCRLGGEEFAVLLINADAASAEALAERIRQGLSRLTVTCSGAAVTFTVSVGGTSRAPGGDSVEAMLKRADRALYAAKQGGRNQTRME